MQSAGRRSVVDVALQAARTAAQHVRPRAKALDRLRLSDASSAS